MASSSIPLTILVLAILSPAFGDSDAQKCSDDFSKLAEQMNMSDCKRLRTLGAEFGWNYHNTTNSATHIEVLFGATLEGSEGWIAWGVNPGEIAEMVGTKAIVGIKHSDETFEVNTYDITKETKGGCRLLPSNVSFQVSNMVMKKEMYNFYTIYARLVLPSKEYNITRLNHVWQVGYAVVGDQPLRHPTTLGNVDSTETIDLTSSGGRSTGQLRSYLRSVHGVLNIMGWGTLIPIGMIIARYFRVFPFKLNQTWFYLHIGCQLTGFLIGTAGWAIGLSLGHSSRYYTFHDHRTYAILIFTFSTVQMLAFRLKPDEADEYRKYWNMYHHFLGYALMAIIIINIFKGITILEGGDAWKWSYIGILALLGAIGFGLEIFTWIRFFMLKSNHSHNHHNQTNNKRKSSTDKNQQT